MRGQNQQPKVLQQITMGLIGLRLLAVVFGTGYRGK
jgi:hypothetical protein